jgi:hypothetical protein
MDQIFQVAGAGLILVAFISAQRNAMSPHSVVYLALNLVGSIVLTGVALHGQDWGFLLLEFVWAVVSAWGLWQLSRGRTPTAAH